jgi:hypothetical protein
MKLVSQRRGFWCFTLILMGALTAHAHDPGLSTATITVADHRIDLVLGLAEKDVESLLGSCGDPVEIRNPEAFAAIRSQLESLAAKETNLQLGDRITVPEQTAAKLRDGQNIEILLRFETTNGRWLIAFCFGLVHGLGFAGALKESGIGSGQFGIILPLVGFNLGVEIGQLSVAAIVLPILWQLRKRPGHMRQWGPWVRSRLL